MDPTEWLTEFRAVHERARKGQLSIAERAKYLTMREELARSVAASQGLTVPVGQQARRHFRVAHLYQLEVKGQYKTMTRDLSRAGFSALIAGSLVEGEEVDFKLSLSRSGEPLQGRARVVAVTRQAGNCLVSLAIESMNEKDTERLELALFDAVLERIAPQ